ncbi:MAG: hypothetical protein JO308_12860, partial [Verrucomicrobia bacterium]|nr:hypothetical protein [Verrucomicrobiota bacterium]
MGSSIRSNCSALVLSSIGLLISLVSNSLALDPAQSLGQLRLVRWDEDQGLPENLTPRIAQTKDGFLWLGFNHGLVRFDGKHFAVDKEIHANIKLPADVFALLPTPSGELWIASEGALYCRLTKGEFRRFDTKDGLPNDFFDSLFLDSEGTIWIGTENHGLFQYKQDQFRSYALSVDLSRQEIFSFGETPGGVLWIGTAFGVYRIEKASGEVKRFSSSDGLPGEQVYALTVDREGSVWAGTGKGLARMDNDGRFHPFGDLLGNRPIQTLMTDSHGMIWVSASGGGLWRIKPETDEISELPPENGHSVPDIRQVYEDREGNIWLATNIGLERLSDVKFTTYTTRDGLPSDDVVAVAAGSSGRVWVGTNNGLARFDQGKIEVVSPVSNGGQNPGVTVLYEDPEGVLWFGLRDATLRRFQGGLERQVARLNVASGPGYATGILVDQEGNLWVGTNGAGLQLFRNGEMVKSFTLEDGLRDRAVFSLGIDREQTLWIGETLSADVLRQMKIKPAPGENAQVLRSTVFSFYADPDGALWIGTFNGLCRYKNGRWAPVVYRPSERGVGPEFYCLLEDDHGNLWSNGPHGVFLVPKRALNDFFDGKRSSVSCQGFGKADGLKSPQHGNADGYFQAGCRSSDGRFWFATSSGLAVIDPNHLQLNPLPPPVQIEQVVVDLTQVFPFRPDDPQIKLGPGTHSVEFDYAGLSFCAPEKVQFKYQLKGFDKDWIDAGTRREAYYTNLPPGSYQFRVIACNNDGLWMPEQAAAATTLILQPHFY